MTTALTEVALGQGHPLAVVLNRRVQSARDSFDKGQAEQAELLRLAMSLLPRVNELHTQSLGAFQNNQSQLRVDRASGNWLSTRFLPKFCATAKLTWNTWGGAPRYVHMALLDPDFDDKYFNIDTKVYRALQLAEEAGLVTIHEEVHPMQTQGLPTYVPVGASLTKQGKAYLASLKTQSVTN